MLRFSGNSRVCFIGDSITATEHGYTELIAQHFAEKLPNNDMRFYVGAVPGGTAFSQNLFFEDDILIYKPDHAVIMLGTNDSNKSALGPSRDNSTLYSVLLQGFEEYKANINRLIDRCLQNNMRVTLCSPPPHAEYQTDPTPTTDYKGGCALMTAYAHYCKSLAESRGIEFCDVHGYLTREMLTANLFMADRVHPNELGHHKIAECILKSMGIDNYEAKPLSEPFIKRAELRRKISYVYIAECNIFGGKCYKMNLKEKYKIAKDLLENPEITDNHVKILAKAYLEDKPRLDEIYTEYIKQTDIIMGFKL